MTDIGFAADHMLWAFGYGPPGGAGEGDWTILRSGDDGGSWLELPWTYQHNLSPRLSFATARQGWIAVVDMSRAESVIRATKDGGMHWRRLPFRNLFVDELQYLGDGMGLFSTSSPFDPHAYLYATADDGRTWRKTELPNGFRLERLAFTNATQGFVAGCRYQSLVVLRTDDGGRNWKTTELEKDPAGSDGCAFDADALQLLPDGDALILAQKHVFQLGDSTSFSAIWKGTGDGREWTRVFVASANAKPNEGGLLLDGPYRLGTRTIVAFRQDRPTMLYSGDAGASWSEVRIAHPISGCYGTGSQLTCAGASPFGLAVLTPR